MAVQQGRTHYHGQTYARIAYVAVGCSKKRGQLAVFDPRVAIDIGRTAHDKHQLMGEYAALKLVPLVNLDSTRRCEYRTDVRKARQRCIEGVFLYVFVADLDGLS